MSIDSFLSCPTRHTFAFFADSITDSKGMALVTIRGIPALAAFVTTYAGRLPVEIEL
jgi:hypothetical protein